MSRISSIPVSWWQRHMNEPNNSRRYNSTNIKLPLHKVKDLPWKCKSIMSDIKRRIELSYHHPSINCALLWDVFIISVLWTLDIDICLSYHSISLLLPRCSSIGVMESIRVLTVQALWFEGLLMLHALQDTSLTFERRVSWAIASLSSEFR